MTRTPAYFRIFAAPLIVAAVAAVALAQSPKDSFVIYAKAGRINQAVGQARVRAVNGDTAKLLTVSDELNDGDVVTTGMNSRVEVLLSPGSFLRLGADSEFQLVDRDLSDIKLKLIRGNAVIETGGGPDAVLSINVALAANSVLIDRKGIYRFNLSGERAEVLVYDGRTQVMPQATKLKGGQRAIVDGNAPALVAKFDRKAVRDQLDGWSRERAEYLAKANRSLNARDVSLAMNSFGSLYSGSHLAGFWVFSRRFGTFLFCPFDPFDWNSPYGFGYSNGYGWPYYGGWNGHNNNNGNGSNNGSSYPNPGTNTSAPIPTKPDTTRSSAPSKPVH